MGQAVGIVEALQPSLAAGTERALADRILGITLELDYPPLAHPRHYPASGTAFVTGRGVERGHTGDHVFIGHDVGNKFPPGRLASWNRRGGASRTGDLKKRPSAEPF